MTKPELCSGECDNLISPFSITQVLVNSLQATSSLAKSRPYYEVHIQAKKIRPKPSGIEKLPFRPR